jgi:hypothetical protein
LLTNQFHNISRDSSKLSKQYRNTIALLSKIFENFAEKLRLSTLYYFKILKNSSSSRGCGKCGKTEKSTLYQVFKTLLTCGKPVEKIG